MDSTNLLGVLPVTATEGNAVLRILLVRTAPGISSLSARMCSFLGGGAQVPKCNTGILAAEFIFQVRKHLSALCKKTFLLIC
jgi:hypothetical protein